MTQVELLELLARAKAEGWKELDLAGMDLEELPPEIGELTELEVLILGKWDREAKGNRLKTLSAEIGQLSQLTTLDLSDNQLSSLPPEIGQLSQLTTLDLSSNQLSSLPPEIGQLSKLTTLDLSDNQLSRQLLPLTNLGLGNDSEAEDSHLSQWKKWKSRATQSELKLYKSFSLFTTIVSGGNRLSSLPESFGQRSNHTNH